MVLSSFKRPFNLRKHNFYAKFQKKNGKPAFGVRENWEKARKNTLNPDLVHCECKNWGSKFEFLLLVSIFSVTKQREVWDRKWNLVHNIGVSFERKPLLSRRTFIWCCHHFFSLFFFLATNPLPNRCLIWKKCGRRVFYI